MQDDNIKFEICQKAREIGFDDIKFALPIELKEEGNFLKLWLGNKMHGDMLWFESGIEERINPKLILPDIKSVIVLAKSYLNYIEHTSKHNKISRYAWGEDYHNVIKPMIKQLALSISEFQTEHKFYISVDSGRVLEKVWAKKAGLGWQGRNSIIIHPQLGSFFFIAVIFSSYEFTPDLPIQDMCGKCELCIKSCPTKAINSDRSINSNKCLSYWLNEASRNTNIPAEIQQKNDEWIYGCDTCQDVCPFNKKALITNEPLFLPKKYGTNLEIDEILEMNEDKFKEIFGKSSIYRLKLKGLQTNARKQH